MPGVLILPAVETTSVSDSGNTLIVLLVTLFLVIAGVALTVVAVWYWRSTEPDPEPLGPLHSMSSRRFATLDAVEQRRSLDLLRPSLANESSARLPMVPNASEVADEAEDSAVDLGRANDADVIPVAVESAPVDMVDEEPWPGDDWSDLDALMRDEPELVVDAVEEHPETSAPTAHRPSSAPIDPLIG